MVIQRVDTYRERMVQKAREVEIISNFEMLERVKKLPQRKSFHASSFPRLCKTINDFMSGEVVTITGFTSSGKTLLCRSLTVDFCGEGHIPLWFTYEESPRDFLGRFSINAVDLQFFMPVELETYSPEWLLEVIRRGHEEKGTNIVFIDNLAFVLKISDKTNTSAVIGDMVVELKKMAVDLDMLIFLMCPTTKVSCDSPEELKINIIKDSSMIGHTSDTVIISHRIVTYDALTIINESFLKVVKSRRAGDIGTIIETRKDGDYLREVDQ